MQDTGSGAVCADVLAALPKWFGFPESVAGYVEAAESEPTVMATLGERDCGILTLRIHTPYAAEIIVMGVLPEHHRAGIGQAMLKAAESWLASATSGTCRSRRSARATPTRDTTPRGPSTSAAASGRWRRCPSSGVRTSRRCR